MKKIAVFISAVLYGVATGNAVSAAPNDEKLNQLKQKYDLENPNAKRTSQSTYNKIKSKNYSRNSGDNVEQRIINKYYTNPDQTGNVDTSNFTTSDIETRFKLGIAEAKQISQQTTTPSTNSDGSFNVKYHQNGTTDLKRNDEGEVIFTEKSNSDKGSLLGENMDSTQLVGNDLNHSDNQTGGGSEFTVKDKANSDIGIKTSVQGNLNYYQNSNEGSGTMAVDGYKSIVKGSEENQVYMDQEDPLLSASYTTLRSVNEQFDDCSEVTETIQVTESFPSTTTHHCAAAESAGPSYCELHREVVSSSSVTYFTSSIDSRQRHNPTKTTNSNPLTGSGTEEEDIENQMFIKGYKHSDWDESGHWDTYKSESLALYNLGGALISKESTNDTEEGTYSESLNFHVGVTPFYGRRWNGTSYNTFVYSKLPFNNNPGSAIYDAELELGVTGEWDYAPNYPGDYANTSKLKFKGKTNYMFAYYIDNVESDDAAVVVIKTNNTSLPITDYDPYDYDLGLTVEDEVVENLIKRTVIAVDERCIAYGEPDLYGPPDCREFVREVASVKYFYFIEKQLNNSNRKVNIRDEIKEFFLLDSTALELTLEIYSNNNLQTFRWPHKRSQSTIKRLDKAYASQGNGDFKPLPTILTFKYVQPAMVVETIQKYFPEGCMEAVTAPEAKCWFDGTFTPLDQGTRGYPNVVLNELLPLYSGDDGFRTWVAEANNYKCDPFGGKTRTVDGVAYTWDDVVAKSESCNEFSSNIQCELTESSCDFYDYEDPNKCLLEQRVYECNEPVTIEREIEVTTNTCDMELPCTGGECETEAKEKSEEFDDAMIGLALAEGMKSDRGCTNDADPDSCVVFQGEARQCRYETTFSLGNNCCEAPGGVNPVEFAVASWQMGKTTGLNSMVYDYAETGWDAASKVISESDIGQSISSGWDTLSKSITNAYDSVAGNVANEVATDTGTEVITEAGQDAVMDGVANKTYEVVYDSLPDDLANLLFEKSGDQIVLSSGVETAFTYVGYIATAYSYYTYFKLALNLLTQCNDNEDSPEYDADMGVLVGNKLCMKVETVDVGALAVQREQRHCCFESALARVVMEQALPQLGYDKKSYRSAGCPGLTPVQISQLDWELMDLDEYYALLVEGGVIPSATNEEALTGTGRTVNGELRDTTTERTLEKLNANDGMLERQKQLKRHMKEGNVDCTITPRPAVCNYTNGNGLSSGNPL